MDLHLEYATEKERKHPDPEGADRWDAGPSKIALIRKGQQSNGTRLEATWGPEGSAEGPHPTRAEAIEQGPQP